MTRGFQTKKIGDKKNEESAAAPPGIKGAQGFGSLGISEPRNLLLFSLLRASPVSTSLGAVAPSKSAPTAPPYPGFFFPRFLSLRPIEEARLLASFPPREGWGFPRRDQETVPGAGAWRLPRGLVIELGTTGGVVLRVIAGLKVGYLDLVRMFLFATGFGDF